jgi:hypothetical protein
VALAEAQVQERVVLAARVGLRRREVAQACCELPREKADVADRQQDAVGERQGGLGLGQQGQRLLVDGERLGPLPLVHQPVAHRAELARLAHQLGVEGHRACH